VKPPNVKYILPFMGVLTEISFMTLYGIFEKKHGEGKKCKQDEAKPEENVVQFM